MKLHCDVPLKSKWENRSPKGAGTYFFSMTTLVCRSRVVAIRKTPLGLQFLCYRHRRKLQKTEKRKGTCSEIVRGAPRELIAQMNRWLLEAETRKAK